MPDAILEFKGLLKDYGTLRALDCGDQVIPAGEICGLVGQNGAGKTTLLKILATVMEPTAGRVLFEGEDIWSDPVALRDHIGYMPDFFQLPQDLAVAEFLMGFARSHKLANPVRRVVEVIAQVGLEDKLDAYCRGLSRGMVQRLGMARAILHRPKLLLLDEPASGLDPLARQTLFDTLRAVHAEGTTILISSHILGELSDLCTWVGFLHDGKFTHQGATREVVQSLSGGERWVLRLLSAETLPVAKGILEASECVAGVEDIAPTKLSYAFAGDDAQAATLLAQLSQQNVAVVEYSILESTLHEAYLAASRGEANHV